MSGSWVAELQLLGAQWRPRRRRGEEQKEKKRRARLRRGRPAERRVGALEPLAELLEHLPLGVARRVLVHLEEVGVRQLKLDKHELAVLPRLREVPPDPVSVQRVRAGPGARPDLLMALFDLSYLML